MTRRNIRRSCLPLVLLLVLLSLPMAGAAQAPPATQPTGWDYEQYFALFMMGERAGHIASSERKLPDGRIEAFTRMAISIGRGTQNVKMTVTRTSVESADGKPISFQEYRLLGLKPVLREGRIVGDRLETTITQGEQQIKGEQEWDGSALFEAGKRRLLMEKLKADGDEVVYTEHSTDHPGDGFVKTTARRVGWEEIEVLGEKVRALRIVVTSAALPMPMKCWVDEEFRELALTIPLGPLMTIRAEACSAEFAQQQFQAPEVFSATLAKLSAPLTEEEKVKSLRLTLRYRDPLSEPLALPQSDRQKIIESTKEHIVLELVRPDYPASQPDELTDDLRQYLQAAEQFNVDDPLIRQAGQTFAEISDVLKRATAIRNWTDRRLVVKSLSVGQGSASEAIRTRRGDCTEHAALLVAVARAAGIPARTVSGLVHVPRFGRDRDVLGGHEWAQLHIHGRWVDFDAALPGEPATVCRVAVTIGSPDGKQDGQKMAAFMRLVGNIKTAEVSDIDRDAE